MLERIRPGNTACITALLAAGAVATTLAATTLYLARDELICDGERSLCIDGTLGYDTNPRLLWLQGRVNATAPPGMLRITLKGTNRLGHVRFAPMEIRLRGRATEIVDFRMIPDYPDVNNWQIDRIVFLADGDD